MIGSVADAAIDPNLQVSMECWLGCQQQRKKGEDQFVASMPWHLLGSICVAIYCVAKVSPQRKGRTKPEKDEWALSLLSFVMVFVGFVTLTQGTCKFTEVDLHVELVTSGD